MWTYNSAKALEKSLSSIKNAINETNVCHRIAVDGGSIDGTQDILSRYGWTVVNAARRGIPFQANQALAMVDTGFFAAFEHDIILNSNWFDRISGIVDSTPRIGAAQGIRLFAGSKAMKAIEEWLYRAKRIPVWSYSMDNTLFRTDAVKDAGGFSYEDPASADTILRRNMFRIGYRWVTDNALISGHYRKDFLEQIKHQTKSFELARYYWSSSPQGGSLPRRIVSLLGGNPVLVLDMARQSRMLRIPIAWYILRLQRGIYLNLPHENKAVVPVAMDDQHLRQFQKVVTDSSESYPQHHPCKWCTQATGFVYSVPTDWGNILPRFHPGIGRKFHACSDEHAMKIAERIFKNAFDYVVPNR